MRNNSVLTRINKVCMNLILRYPFYGYLLMHMDKKETKKEKAYTDMKSIFLNYKAIEELDDNELEFVILHETLHAALKHPINVEGHDKAIYNLAADIMVNTIILDSLNVREIRIGHQIIMKSTFGNEVYKMGTEKIYQRLMEERKCKYVKDMLEESTVDSHQNWGSRALRSNKEYLYGMWEKNVAEARAYEVEHGVAKSRGVGVLFSEMLCDSSNHVSETEWKKLLHDFMKVTNEKYDYTFSPPDRRFDSYEVFLPDYNNVEDKKLGKLWFCVDTSLSMQQSEIAAFYVEIEKCIQELGNLDGLLSFFDEEVTPPVSFHTVEDIWSIKPVGGGGTSFEGVFDYMRKNMIEQPPTAIIIMTDGYAFFPSETAACGIPVLWSIIGGNSVVPPWGSVIYV